jgi:hypothetical protein
MPGQNRRAWRLVAGVAAAAACLAACANSGEVGTGQSVTGNERGGKLPYQDGAVSSAMSAAQAHCGKFGKKAQITQMTPSGDGGQIAFECN